MSWKMFCASQHTIILHSVHVLGGQSRNQTLILTKRSTADYRVQRIAVYIYHRCEVDMDTYSLALTCNLLSNGINQGIAFAGTQCHLPRESNR